MPFRQQLNQKPTTFLDYVVSLEADGDVDAADMSGLAELADAKRTKAKHILDSILLSGDGLSPDTSYFDISIFYKDDDEKETKPVS